MIETTATRMSLTTLIVLILNTTALQSSNQYPLTYNYFGYGSNVVTSTMTDMRRITPLAITAAILPNHRLRFNLPGLPGFEPSAASVEPSPGDAVHGLCYTLTAEDFGKVGQSEGVPFGYKWQPVYVATYVGNDHDAGLQAALLCKDSTNIRLVYTLIATFPTLNDIPPSKSYLGLIQQGASEWKMDRAYQDNLKQIKYDTNLLVTNGIAGATLSWAEMQKKLFR